MIFKRIPLDIPAKDLAELKSHFNKLAHFIEHGGFLNTHALAALQEKMTAVIDDSAELKQVLECIHSGSEFFHVNLCHPDAEILNMPWGIALDPFSQRPLNEVERLYFSKKSRGTDVFFQPTAGPLKILVMISSPEDLPPENRLNFEKEEQLLIKAFEPLLQARLVSNPEYVSRLSKEEEDRIIKNMEDTFSSADLFKELMQSEAVAREASKVAWGQKIDRSFNSCRIMFSTTALKDWDSAMVSVRPARFWPIQSFR